jgi:hypothetical protein
MMPMGLVKSLVESDCYLRNAMPARAPLLNFGSDIV